MDKMDETLRMYIEESLDHLSSIESDLLAIEEDGADIDEELVNKVFRAAHSIKGGAGFLNLVSIKELSHRIESVLDLIRSRELAPNPDIVNILLLAFDRLRELLSDVEASGEADIAEFVASLAGIAKMTLPAEDKVAADLPVDVGLPDGRVTFRVSSFDLERALKGGRYLFLVEFDLIHDVHHRGKKPLEILKLLDSSGTIVDCLVDISAVGTLEEEPVGRIPFFVLYSTLLEQGMVHVLLSLEEGAVTLVGESGGERLGPAFAASPEPLQAAGPAESLEDGERLAEELAAARMEEDFLEHEAAQSMPPTHEMEVHREAHDHCPADSNDPACQESGRGESHRSGPVETSLRVNVNLLENLMNLAGELVLSRNQLIQAISQDDRRSIQACGQRINLVTSELQEAIMLTRMQPIGNVMSKFPRVVRDLARTLGKDVRLALSGKEVEMDKTIIEALSDPLTHLVRNAVDHGVETPAERQAAGKAPQGAISLRAFHEAGQVNIEIQDDGHGIDPDKIAQVALTKGLVTQDQVKAMSRKEKLALVFLPGLSTARKLTDVSGRGVGMDVVKTNLDRLGGMVEIDSELGRGSTFRIKLPLTLAIIPSLLVSVGRERFAVPQVNVDELIRIPAAQVKERIELVGDAEVLILRGELIPIVNLASVLGIQETYQDQDGQVRVSRRRRLADRRSRSFGPDGERMGPNEEPGEGPDKRRSGEDRRYHASSDMNIVIVSAGAFRYGLVVQELHDTVEIVVKPLGRHLKGCHGYAGATIMGDGRVALILDVSGLADAAQLASVSTTVRAEAVREQASQDMADRHSLLMFKNGPEEQCAMPLDLVQRVEQVRRSAIEVIGERKVMQYRGGTLPLVALSDATAARELPPSEDLIVIVARVGQREVGLLATPPVDALEARFEPDAGALTQRGIMGSAVISGRTTLLVDIFEIVQTVLPQFFVEAAPQEIEGKIPTILLAEDSEFFAGQIKKFIENNGYKVVHAPDGQAAWETLQDMADEIMLLVTDIEMPKLDGYGLSRNVRGTERFARLPIIAVTSLAGDEDIARGKEAGIDDYQVKLDRERLLSSITNYLKPRAQ